MGVMRFCKQILWIVIASLCLVWNSAQANTQANAQTNIQTNETKSDAQLAAEFEKTVSPRISIPAEVAQFYSGRLQEALLKGRTRISNKQYLVLVDRNPHVQMVMVYLGSSTEGWELIGAAPASTGLPGKFDHFLTPLGIFDHSLDNLDFRAEGTKNEFGFRGYGVKGMRVYDFGWVEQARGWGNRGKMLMRLQMHSTDPELAEKFLGKPRSKGCIRIPASLNDLIDRYGLLDAEYDAAIDKGVEFWVMRKDRTPVAFPGRYLVVIDSEVTKKPVWMRK